MGDERTERRNESDNPFAPPSAALSAEPVDRPAHYGDASRGQRFVNMIFDYFGTLVVLFFIGILLAALRRPANFGFLMNYLLGMIAGILYYFSLEVLTGRTLGKLITGTRVVDEHGNKPSARAVFIRTLCRYVPFEPFSVLADGSGWHDEWSHARVVRVRPGPKSPYEIE